MNCDNFKEHTALMALGSLDEQTRAQCEEHLREAHHEGCIEALDSAMQAVDSLTPQSRSTAGEHAWNIIQARLGTRRAPARWPMVLVAVLSCVVVGLAVDRNALQQRLNESEGRVQTLASSALERDDCLRREQQTRDEQALRAEAVELLRLPGTALFALAPEKGQSGNANVIIHTGVKRAYVAAEGLIPRADRDYEMWVARGSKVVSAGLVHVGADGKAILRVEYASLLGGEAAPDAMMITLEPRGGSTRTPGPTVIIGTRVPG